MGFGPTADAAPATASPPPQGLPDPAPQPSPTDAAPASANGVASAADGGAPQGDKTGEGQGLPQPGADTQPPPADTPPAIPWADAQDVDAVLAVESVAARLETMRAEAKTEHLEEGRRTAQSQLQPVLQGNQQKLGEIKNAVQSIVRIWNKAVKDETFSHTDATDSIEEHREAFETLAQVQLESGRWEGRGEWINLAGKIDPAIPSEFGPRFQALQQGLDDPTFTDDFLKAVGKAVADPIKAELKEANAHVARLEAEAKTAGRGETKPPAPTGGLGGAGAGKIGPDAIIQSPTSTVDEKKAAFNEKYGGDIARDVPMS